MTTPTSSRVARAALALVLTLTTAGPAMAQRTLRTVGTDLWNAGTDVWAVWSAPLHAGARDWATAAAVTAGGVAFAPIDDDVDRWVVRNADGGFARALEPIRENRGTNLGDLPTGRLILPLSGGLYLAGFVADQPGLRDAALGCLASQQANSAVRHATYALVARTRPSEFDGGARSGDQFEIDVPGEEWERRSFFGGHVANAFACAAFFSERFELGLAEPVLYLFATGVVAGRTLDRRHWLSDDVLGAAFGYAVGRAVAHRQKARMQRRDGAAQGAQAPPGPRTGQPLFDVGTSRTRVGWEISF